MSPQPHPEVTVRADTQDDISACGQICYDAFSKLSAKHSFPSDVPDVQTATNILFHVFFQSGLFTALWRKAEGTSMGTMCLTDVP